MFVFALANTAARADGPEPTARIKVDATGPADGGLIVELAMAGSPPMTWTRDLDAARPVADFPHLAPGIYRLTARGTAEAATVEVRIDPGTDYEFAIRTSAVTPQKDGWTLELLHTHAASGARIYGPQMLATFPGEDALWSVAETAAAPLIADRIATGGLRVAGDVLTGGPGGSGQDTTIAFGAIDVTDPLRPGATLVAANHAPADSLMVLTYLLPPAVEGPGPLLTFVPPASPSVWIGSITAGMFPSGWQARNAQPNLPSIERLIGHRDTSVEAGGPAGAHRGLFLSARGVSADRVERDDPAWLHSDAQSVYAHATATTGDRGRVELTGTVDRIIAPFSARARMPQRSSSQRDLMSTVHATWDRWASDGTVWSTSAAIENGALAISTPNAAVGGSTVPTIERLRDGPVDALIAAGPGRRSRWLARADVQPAISRLGTRQTLSAGLRLERNAATTQPATTLPIAEFVAGHAARLWQFNYGAEQTRWRSTVVAGYINDGVDLGDNVRLDAGVRLDTSRGRAAHAAEGITWASMAPRLQARWEPRDSGHVAVFGGYSRYSHPLRLENLAVGDPAAASGAAYRWDDADGNGVFSENERGPLVAAVGPCCAAGVPNVIDTDLHRPSTDEYVAGIEANLRGWSVRATGVGRRTRKAVVLRNVGAGDSSYVTRWMPDPGEDFVGAADDRLLPVFDRLPSTFGQDRYLLTNTSGPDASYEGFDLMIDGRVGRRWRTRLDGVAYRSEGVGANRGFGSTENDYGVLGEAFVNPNAATYAVGHGFFDRQYVIKWWNSYEAPKQVMVSAVARYQDGQPFARMVLVPDLNQGAELIPAYRRGRTRFTFTFTLDAHVEKSVAIGRVRLAGVFEVFNLLNTSEEVEENVLTTPAFRTPTALQPPRTARVAIKVGF